jgi:L-asparagine transporter-like permease
MWAWVLIFWALFSVLSTLGIVVYGELEYYLGWFKICSLAVCFFISFLVNVGAFGNGYIGFRYWTPPQGKRASSWQHTQIFLITQVPWLMESMDLAKYLSLRPRTMLERRLSPWQQERRRILGDQFLGLVY